LRQPRLCAFSFVFRCRKNPGPGDLDFPYSAKELPRELIEEPYARVLRMVPEEHRDKLAAAHTTMYVRRADWDAASRLLDRYQRHGPYSESCVLFRYARISVNSRTSAVCRPRFIPESPTKSLEYCCTRRYLNVELIMAQLATTLAADVIAP
jgi:hypothetical protein